MCHVPGPPGDPRAGTTVALDRRVALIAPLFAFVGRFVGRVLTMAFGWASTLLFGQVPQSKQLLLSGISLGSILWVATLIGVIVPDAGTFMIGFIPLPDWVDDNLVRIAMLVAAIVLPILVGIGGIFVVDAADRPKGMGMVVQVLRGYPYSAVLALTLLLMIVVAPIRKVRSLIKRWEDAHIPVMVKPGGYERVADDLEHAVDAAGFDIERVGAPRILELPSKILAAVGGAGVRRLVPDRLIVLQNRELEVMIHPSDVSLSGTKAAVARGRSALASRLTFTAAYLTSTKESQDIEDRLEKIWRAVREIGEEQSVAERVAGLRSDLQAVDKEMETLTVDYDEWEVLYRQRLQVERDLLNVDVTDRDESSGGGPLKKVAELVKNAVSST